MKSKKGLIIATICVAISITLMFTVYEVTPILDPVVENVAKVLGTKTEKMIKKEEIAKQEEIKAEKIKEEIKKDSIAANKSKLPEYDSVVLAAIAKKKADSILAEAKKEKRKNLFANSVTIAPKKEEKKDSVVAIVDPKEEKRKSLFKNSFRASTGLSGNKVTNNLSWFNAEIHGSQKFKHNELVTLRTDGKVSINGHDLPENYIFKAKANIFDGKLTLIVDKLETQELLAKSYTSQSAEGIVLKAGSVNDKGEVFFSDGTSIMFGYN